MGSFSTAGWNKIFILLPFLVIGLTLIFIHTRHLNVISTGKTAKSWESKWKGQKDSLAVCSVVTVATAKQADYRLCRADNSHVLRLWSLGRVPDAFFCCWWAAFLVICDTLQG